jgi:hypothetical protein
MTAPQGRLRTAGDSPAALALAAIDRPVSLFASALAGRTLVPCTATAQAAAGQADRIMLPPELLAGVDLLRPWGAMRIEVLRHVVQLQPGGRWHFDLGVAAARELVGPGSGAPADDALRQCLASWPRPVLLRRLFRIIDAGRVDARLELQFPGARAGLQALRTAALARLSPARHPLRSLLQALQRQALGLSHPPHDLALAADAMRSTASVYDSLQAAIGIAAVLGQGRRRGLGALPRWLHIEPPSETQGLPVVENGSGGGSSLDPADGFSAQAVRHARISEAAADGESSALAAPGRAAATVNEASASDGRFPGDAAARPSAGADVFRHDEWHYLEQRYRKAWTHVHEHRLRGEDLQFLARLRQRHAGLAAGIRRRIGKVPPQSRQRARHLRDGDEIDVAAAIEARIERRAGDPGDGRVYTALQPARREVCAAFLLDISGSTGFLVPDMHAPAQIDIPGEDDDPYFYASPQRSLQPPPARRRVIDVAKDAIGLMCDALAGLGDRHAVYGFSGAGRHRVDFYVAKGFDDRWSAHCAAALARMEPKGSTRTGAAIRHAARKLARQPEHIRLLIVVTDGYPQDSDYGPDTHDIEYGLRDTAQAMKEAERAGIAVFCVSVDHAAHDYLRRLCPASRYLVIDEVGALPQQLAKVYRRLISCR